MRFFSKHWSMQIFSMALIAGLSACSTKTDDRSAQTADIAKTVEGEAKANRNTTGEDAHSNGEAAADAAEAADAAAYDARPIASSSPTGATESTEGKPCARPIAAGC